MSSQTLNNMGNAAVMTVVSSCFTEQSLSCIYFYSECNLLYDHAENSIPESDLRLSILATPLLISVLMSAGPALADEWKKLVNEEIIGALTEREVIYKNQGNSSQSFYKNGDTGFVEGRPSFGKWRVENNQYCSQWPPSSAWACYDVYLHATGNIVRFRGADEVNWDGTYR